MYPEITVFLGRHQLSVKLNNWNSAQQLLIAVSLFKLGCNVFLLFFLRNANKI